MNVWTCENCLKDFPEDKVVSIRLHNKLQEKELSGGFIDGMLYCIDCAKKVKSFDDIVKVYRRV